MKQPSQKKARGVIYVYWGDTVEGELDRSVNSLQRFHSELPFEKIKLENNSTLLNKARMLELSPFKTTLFLDTDTMVMDRLDFGFEKAEQHGLACCINECPWARRYTDIAGDQIEYNTGVLFFTQKAEAVFKRWEEIAHSINSAMVFFRNERILEMPNNDQAGFSQAVVDTGFNPFVLPLNWNLRPQWQRTFFGPIKVWHDRSEPPLDLKSWNEDQGLEQSILKYSGDHPDFSILK
ncbi:MAG: hypothetical protein O7C75_04825 [Verrucomicrobia bacterium]|nr:hypothetical protein [Verrucomicrobiota bacterium]